MPNGSAVTWFWIASGEKSTFGVHKLPPLFGNSSFRVRVQLDFPSCDRCFEF